MPSPPPREHLDPRALRLWRIAEGVESIVFFAIALGLSAVLIAATDLPRLVAIAPIAVALIFGVADVVLVPSIRWRHWRYEIGDLEVDLERGIWTITRTRVPMSRIQHVDTRRGPLEQRLGLATVVLYTAAGASEIPALSLSVADEVRDRIATLANVHDDV